MASDNYANNNIFDNEKKVINKLNDYNAKYFGLARCKVKYNSLPGTLTQASDPTCYAFTNSGTSWNDLTAEHDALNNAIVDLKTSLDDTSNPFNKSKYDGSMNYINDLVKNINATRSEYDPKLQQIIENSNRSNSQNAVDSTVYSGIVISIGLASLLFFAFAKADSMK